MKSESRANHESEPNFEEYNSELRQKLTDLGNFLTMAPSLKELEAETIIGGTRW